MTGVDTIRACLARYRDKPAIGLDITFPINWQLDMDLAGALKADLSAHGQWEMMRATPTLGNMIPSKTGLYMFVFRSYLELSLSTGAEERPTWVLYVGRAGSPQSSRTLKNRYVEEYSRYIGGDPKQLWDDKFPTGREELLKKYLTIWPLEYWWLVVEDREEIPHLEDRLIKLFAPPLNTKGRLRVRASAPEPAFRSI